MKSARKTIAQYFECLTAGEAEQLLKSISKQNFLKIGTDEGEIVTGVQKAAEYYRHHVASTDKFSIETRRLDVHERDTISWFFTEQVWTLEWKGTPETLAMRITGVLENQDALWKFVQIHASLGFGPE